MIIEYCVGPLPSINTALQF